MEQKIPKIINYCWFGNNPKSRLIEKCIKSWKKYCPDYEIVEWNESNFDVNCNDYVREAYENKKWAFVSDYVRLYAVFNNGGIYLDTDVELIGNIDHLLQSEAFLSCENEEKVNTGVGFGAVKEHAIIGLLLDSYKDIHFKSLETGELDLTPCTTRNTETLIAKYGDISSKINSTIDKDVMILGKEYFSPFNQITGKMDKTDKTVGIHWYAASWRSKKINFREKALRPIKRVIGVDRFNKLRGK